MGLGLGVVLFGAARSEVCGRAQRLLSCRSNERGHHFLSMVDSAGQRLLDIALPGRAHDVAIDPARRQAAVFARRPGDFVWVLDLSSGEVTHRITAEPGRHFYGHGLFTADGSRLLCSENAYESGEGVIGIYDAGANYQRIGEFPSHGIGPHEIRLLSDGRTLAVANGGIRTHPDLPRVRSNLSTMRPNLSYVDIASGRLLHRHEPDPKWHQLSIRHIDVSPDDRVAVVMQYEGRPHLHPPLIAIQQGDQPMRFLTAPSQIQRRLKNYCGSVAFSANGLSFAVSSPRGGVVTFWSTGGEFLGFHEQADACGISRAMDGNNGFFVSDGNGRILCLEDSHFVAGRRLYPDCRWDNHMVTL